MVVRCCSTLQDTRGGGGGDADVVVVVTVAFVVVKAEAVLVGL